MNYQRIYDQIIDRAKKEKRTKGQGIYYESHHIVPRCLGGSDKRENLLLLTAREHFICHWLLSRMYPGNNKLIFAFHAMTVFTGSKFQSRYTPSSRAVQEAKELSSEIKKGQTLEEKVGKERADQLRKENSERKKGRSNANKGVKKSEEAVAKRTATRKERDNYRRTEKSIEKGIQTRKEKNSYVGRTFSQDHKKKLSKIKEKPIKQYTLSGEYVTGYVALSTAAKTLNINISGISRALTGKVPNYRGFIWKYA